MFKRIDHIEVIPQDFARAMQFYTEILGFKIKNRLKVAAPPLEEVAYLELGDTVVELAGQGRGRRHCCSVANGLPDDGLGGG